jgi:hypothetical protein
MLELDRCKEALEAYERIKNLILNNNINEKIDRIRLFCE